jgi:hypothetical protein
MQVFKRFYDLHFTLSYSLHYHNNVKFYIKQGKVISPLHWGTRRVSRVIKSFIVTVLSSSMS